MVGEAFITLEQLKTIVRANDQNDRNCAKCKNSLSGRFSLGGRCCCRSCCLRGGRSCAQARGRYSRAKPSGFDAAHVGSETTNPQGVALSSPFPVLTPNPQQPGSLAVLVLFPYNPAMIKQSKPTKLSRAQIREGLDQIPIDHILGKRSQSGLTSKQKRFAQEVAKGSTKAQAYRTAYNPNPAPSTIVTAPYKIAGDARVQREIMAYEAAIEAEKHRTPAALRALVIHSLVQVVLDPDAGPAQKVQAAKVLGTVTEVAAFTERKEVRTISSSEDARAKVMGELRRLMTAGAIDANVIDADADSLLSELAAVEPHPDPTPQTSQPESHDSLHTIPLNQNLEIFDTPPSSPTQET